MSARIETTYPEPQNPGSLNNFIESGGTTDEWYMQLDQFRRECVATGLSDAELLQKSDTVSLEVINGDDLINA